MTASARHAIGELFMARVYADAGEPEAAAQCAERAAQELHELARQPSTGRQRVGQEHIREALRRVLRPGGR